MRLKQRLNEDKVYAYHYITKSAQFINKNGKVKNTTY